MGIPPWWYKHLYWNRKNISLEESSLQLLVERQGDISKDTVTLGGDSPGPNYVEDGEKVSFMPKEGLCHCHWSNDHIYAANWRDDMTEEL